ncbi:MAG: ribonuclease [Proteobacteria bacterium]|nr:ribonuclease [Pseudomonadota bacterium]
MWAKIGLVAVMLFGASANAAPHDVGKRPPGAFSYYMLSLSWERGYCDTAPHPDGGECSHPQGFVLHGLWPELDGGDYPTACSRRALPSAERKRSQGLYPNPALITHEWSKHGTCSGLSPAAYFDLSRADLARVAIPDAYHTPRVLPAGEAAALRQALLAVNSGLPTDGVRTVVSHGEIVEVDVCLTKAGAFRPC